MSLWVQSNPHLWIRLDGIRLMPSLRNGSLAWQVEIPSSLIRGKTLYRTAHIGAGLDLELAQAAINKQWPPPSWTNEAPPGLLEVGRGQPDIGNDVVFHAGLVEEMPGAEVIPGNVTFRVGGTGPHNEVFRLEYSGDVFLAGELVDHDAWLYMRFKAWVQKFGGKARADNVNINTAAPVGVQRSGDIVFVLSDGREMLRFRANSPPIVNGTTPTYDPKAVLSAFRLWLTDCSLRKPHPQAPPRRPGPPGPPNAGA
jgi:hypothetical protein